MLCLGRIIKMILKKNGFIDLLVLTKYIKMVEKVCLALLCQKLDDFAGFNFI